ncbi:hypothetical protein AUR64_14400 [Haloprofundus marisrubri]|uniref:Uncharacterized protein n=1 Tax=Haloprofundus marisrubri TaxID=1514971 RepID=A0A0W1R710_9EURY|nr:hypothetical protein [Haloprofundus marisrubri]KTG08993.1 hypothetical protein AUR64_14400 [Haloprofundus marisrubri]
MNQPSSETHPLYGTNQRARTLRMFLIALVGTPWLLLIEPTRRIASLEATIAAIGLGVVCGIVATVGLADTDLQDVNDVTAVVVTLVCICVATLILWLIVPRQYLGAVLQFVLAFSWAMPVSQLLRHYYRAPALS